LPNLDEGFDEIRYLWQDEEQSSVTFAAWMRQMKRTLPVHGLHRSDWFLDRWAKWQRQMQDWQKVLKDWQKVVEQLQEWQQEEKPKDETDFDNEMDVMAVEDVNDVGGTGEPLHAHFEYEDWTLLNLRGEMHLLSHAFSRDVDDPERKQMHEVMVPYYYELYFGKKLSYAAVSTKDFESFCQLISDTVARSSDALLQALLAEDVPLVHFLKQTEQSRRDREKSAMAGDEQAVLKFPVPAKLSSHDHGAAVARAAAPPAKEVSERSSYYGNKRDAEEAGLHWPPAERRQTGRATRHPPHSERARAPPLPDRQEQWARQRVVEHRWDRDTRAPLANARGGSGTTRGGHPPSRDARHREPIGARREEPSYRRDSGYRNRTSR